MTKPSPQSEAPPISNELIQWLDRLYPERCPSPKDGARDIWMSVGRRDVVRRLLIERDRQRRQ